MKMKARNQQSPQKHLHVVERLKEIHVTHSINRHRSLVETNYELER